MYWPRKVSQGVSEARIAPGSGCLPRRARAARANPAEDQGDEDGGEQRREELVQVGLAARRLALVVVLEHLVCSESVQGSTNILSSIL